MASTIQCSLFIITTTYTHVDGDDLIMCNILPLLKGPKLNLNEENKSSILVYDIDPCMSLYHLIWQACYVTGRKCLIAPKSKSKFK